MLTAKCQSKLSDRNRNRQRRRWKQRWRRREQEGERATETRPRHDHDDAVWHWQPTGNWQLATKWSTCRASTESGMKKVLRYGQRDTVRERGRLVGVSGDICFDVVIWLSFGLVRGQPINFHALLRCLHRESPLKWKEMAEGDLFVYLVGLNSSGCRECLCCLHKLWRRRLSPHSFK